MGSALEIGIKIRKIIVFSIRGCYRSVCKHPFLVGFLGFLLLLYRFFPFLFSILVSASPVLVCTAVLLGTLLSFGQPNIPEVEKEEKVTHGISSYQTGFSEGETVVADRDESYFVKGYSENRSDIEESGIEEASLVGERDNRDEEDCGLLSDVPLDDEYLQDIQPEKQVREEVEREFHSIELGKKREVHEDNLRSEGVSSDEEAIEKQYVLVQKVNDDILDNDIENEKTQGDQVDVSLSSSWKQVEHNDDDEEDTVESGSDQAESSSPDASMADIIPMLDELHPLLDVDAPRPAHLSRDVPGAASDKSQKSDNDSVESDADTENQGEVEEDGVDERDDEEEEEMDGGKEDESKSAIKWTEDDQKNLMDLGSLELERNRRLENLIARRRARRLVTEKNLIDLDYTDLPINVAPIATARRNPFDFPDESYADMGLPPIPGSAPSILQPRQNPFDIPYDSNEEKPNLKGDSFQQEFTMFNQKDAFYRRHESFSMGPSVLGMAKHERHDINWKPIFITERMASEGTGYSFQRQTSEASDSKLSSVPDTESVSSIDQDDRKFSEQDLSQEAELISNTDHVSDGVEHGSQSSGENDSMEMIEVEESNVCPDEAEIVLGGVENPSSVEFYPETGDVEIHEQLNAGETHLRREPSDEESSSSSRSSRSSQSEVIDNTPDEKMEQMENLQQGDGHLHESSVSTQASVGEPNFKQVSGEVEENQHVEPVYDSSPPAAERLQSFPSVSSDSATELSERALPSEVHVQRLEDSTSDHEEAQAAPSQPHMEVENELRSEKSGDINQHNVTADDLSAAAPNFVDQNESTMAEGLSSDIESVKGVTNSGFVHAQDLVDHISADSEIIIQDNVDSPDSNHQMASERLHISNNESVDEGAVPNKVSRFDSANMSQSVQDGDEMLDSVASDAHHMSSNDSSMPESSVAHPNLPSKETEHIEEISPDKEDMFRIEKDDVFLSSSVEQGNNDIHQDLDKNIVSFTSDSQQEIDVKSTSNLENHLSSSDKLVVAPSSSDRDKSQNSDVTQVESAEGVVTSNDGVGELHDAMDKTPLNISSVTTETYEAPEFSLPPGEVDSEVDRHGEVENEDPNGPLERLDHSADGYLSQVTEDNIKEIDDMKEIDEAFLSELDTVGDFSVSDASVSLHTDIVLEKTGDAEVSPLANDAIEEETPVCEARSLEDINLAFKQLQEGVDVEEVILPSTTKDKLVSEESENHVDINSGIKVVEARSVEDINIALKQISEGNQGELQKPLDLKGGSAKIEENEVGSAKVIENFDAANSAEEVSKTRVDKPENEPISSSSD